MRRLTCSFAVRICHSTFIPPKSTARREWLEFSNFLEAPLAPYTSPYTFVSTICSESRQAVKIFLYYSPQPKPRILLASQLFMVLVA